MPSGGGSPHEACRKVLSVSPLFWVRRGAEVSALDAFTLFVKNEPSRVIKCEIGEKVHITLPNAEFWK